MYKEKIDEKFAEKMLSKCRGGYLDMNWNIFDVYGEPLGKDGHLRPNCYIVAENYTGYIILHVGLNLDLTECEIDYSKESTEKVQKEDINGDQTNVS